MKKSELRQMIKEEILKLNEKKEIPIEVYRNDVKKIADEIELGNDAKAIKTINTLYKIDLLNAREIIETWRETKKDYAKNLDKLISLIVKHLKNYTIRK